MTVVRWSFVCSGCLGPATPDGKVVAVTDRSLNEDAADLVAHFREFADVTLKRLPLYHYLAGRIAEDEAVASRLLLARPEVRWTTLLMAAVHDRLLAAYEDAGHEPVQAAAAEPLCAWYSSTSDKPRLVGSSADDPWPHFRRLALSDPVVEADLRTRGTQTNEVGRCAPTVLALGLVQREVERPLGLVEIGASAGLNLRVDAYDYRFSPTARNESTQARPIELWAPTEAGDGDRLLLGSEWRGPVVPPVPKQMPDIAQRIGIDIQPVDVIDDASARWLVACQWPEQVERLERCRRAVALAQADPPTIVTGDLVRDTAALVEGLPDEVHPVVLSTWCLAYLSDDDQRSFLGLLRDVARHRDLTFLFQEQLIEVPGLDPPQRPDGGTDERPTSLCRYDWVAGSLTMRRLADHHPHGTWIEWLA